MSSCGILTVYNGIDINITNLCNCYKTYSFNKSSTRKLKSTKKSRVNLINLGISSEKAKHISMHKIMHRYKESLQYMDDICMYVLYIYLQWKLSQVSRKRHTGVMVVAGGTRV